MKRFDTSIQERENKIEFRMSILMFVSTGLERATKTIDIAQAEGY